MRHVLTVLLLLAGPAWAQTSESHPFSVHDMLAMDRISDPQASPDAKRVVFVVRETDLDADRGRTDLWIVNTDGTSLHRLTAHPENDWNPRWSRHGNSVWFLSTRTGSSQVWRIPADGGEAEQFTDLPLDVGSLVMSPTGGFIAFSMDVFPGTTPQETKDRLDEIEGQKSSGRIYDRLFVRHWDTWKDGRRSHVFVMPTAGLGFGDMSGPDELHGVDRMENAREWAAGRIVDIMTDMDADCPTKPFGGPDDYTFTPDGNAVVFTARDAGREEAWSTDFDLYLAPIDASTPPKCLNETNRAWDALPVFSPDGKTLAHLAMRRPGYESDRFRIMLRPWPAAGGSEPPKVENLTESWDRSASAIAWSANGKTIYTTAANLGQRSLFAVDVAGGDVATLVKAGNVGPVTLAADRIVYGLDHLQSPVELYTLEPGGHGQKQITRINEKNIRAAQMGEYEQFTFTGWNGETVYANVVYPVDFDPSRKYPVAFLIHGGPQGSFGNHFHYRWNPQAYAGAGYAAVMVDFHGSTGYGQAFTDSIRGDWGGKPLVDLQKGLAAALEKYPWMDGERVSALGASFGGYMINWIAGNWPDRFRCLVNHDGNLDERFAYFATEELWFPEWDHMGTPWENPEHYEKHNPLRFVQNWKAPMLVIHGALDFRVVDTEGLATFTALQRRGIPSKLLHFPDENHWVLKPANSIQWHETVIGWLDQWTKP